MAQLTYDGLIAMLTLQEMNLPTYTGAVGATAGQIAEVTKDLQNLVYVRDYCATFDADKKTLFGNKSALFNGDVDEPLAPAPSVPAFGAPNALVPDCEGRALKRNAAWKLGPGYNTEVRDALGIPGGSAPPPDPGTVKPTVGVFASQDNYGMAVVASGRGAATMIKVEYLAAGASVWQFLGNFPEKSANFNYAPTPGEIGKPVQLQIRVQGIKSGQNYGLASDPTYVTLNP